MFAYSFASGDFDGDGFTDLMPNGMGGDGLDNCCRDSGELYVLSGREFAARAGRGPGATPCLSRVTVGPASPPYYAGQQGLELHLFCDSGDETMAFREGAAAVLNGVEVPTTVVGPSELLVRLDDAPGVRNTPGPVLAQARNPGSDLSPPVAALTLVGPEIASVRAKRTSTGLRLTIKGERFLAGATASVEDPSGAEVPLASVARKSARKLRVTIAAGAVASGTVLTVRVLNPGPAPSEPATVTAP
jgi:hypothetical protein